MLARYTIYQELRTLIRLWKLHTNDPEEYQFIRGAEFALAWVLDGAKSGCKVSSLVEHRPQFEEALWRALNETRGSTER